MRTLDNIVELILIKHYGGELSDDDDFTKQEVRIFVIQAAAYWAKANLFQNMAEGQRMIDPQFIVTYPKVEIIWDSTQKINYIELPVGYIDLPHDKGIQTIRPVDSRVSDFVRVPKGSFNLAGPELRYLEGNIGWENAGSVAGETFHRIEFHNMDNSEGDLVTLEIVSSGDETKGDEPLRIPGSAELPVMQQVWQILGTDIPADEINNQVDER